MASLQGVGNFISLRQGAKMASRPQFIKNLSKDAIPGRTYRTFIPKVKTPVLDENGNPTGEVVDDFMLSYVVGRDLNFEIYNKVSFMTYEKEWYEMIDLNSYKDLTGVDSYARIMRAAFEAQCEKEKADAEAEAKALAARNGGKLDERALYRKLDNIDTKYHGREAEDGVAAVYATLKPAIGGLHGMLITECLRVPMKTDTNTPDWKNASYHYKRCSKAFINQMIAIMDSPDYNRPDTDYIEISFKFGSEGQKTSEAGRDSTFNPVSGDISLERLYPEEWAEIGRDKVKGIAGGEREAAAAANAVMKDSGFGTIRITPTELASTTKKWAASNLAIFTQLPIDSKETQRAAKDLVSSGILDGLSDIKHKVEEMINNEESGEVADGNTEQATAQEGVEQHVAQEVVTQPVASTVVEEPAVDPARAEKVSAAMDALTEAGSINGRAAGEFLDVPDGGDDDYEDMGEL